TAGVLAHTRQLDVATITALLADTEPGNFHFDDTGLRWRDHDASVAEIREARQGLVHGFGSCSFDEPRDDLRKLGLLPTRESLPLPPRPTRACVHSSPSRRSRISRSRTSPTASSASLTRSGPGSAVIRSPWTSAALAWRSVTSSSTLLCWKDGGCLPTRRS